MPAPMPPRGLTPLPLLDLNLIRALQALIETSSITRTGERLGLSQPAASRVVAKLRQAVGDPLLVRTSKGYVLTPRAEALAGSVHTLIGLAAQVFVPAGFDAATSQREFRVSTTDYGMMSVMATASARLAKIAPFVKIKICPWIDGTLDDLENGRIDLALYADDELPPDFHTRDLFRETYAVLMSADHPLRSSRSFAGRTGLEALAAWPQVVASYPSGRRQMTDDVLAKLKGPAHHVVLETPLFLAAPWLLVGTDRLMILPRRAAEQLALQSSLHWVALNMPELAFEYRLVWHERGHRDPGLSWMRSQIVASLDGTKRKRPS